jgi:hypothetical protein
MDWRFQNSRLTGLSLRYALIVHLVEARRVLTTRELVASLHADGFEIGGRASKAVSDALRWETRRGRVVRVGRGQYAAGVVSRQTVWRMRQRLLPLRSRVVAPT